MAGLSQIIATLRPRCPSCRASIDLTQFSKEIFERILRQMAEGERVYVQGFGTFIARYTPAREIVSFGHVKKKIEGRMQIRFRASEKAKQIINERIEQ